MRCASLESPKVLKIKECEIPEIGEGDILLRIAACAICGTDVKKYFQGHRLIKSYPIVPGHEITGEIVGVGNKAREIIVKEEGKKTTRSFTEGQKVVIAPVIACEECVNCIEGRPESCTKREDLGFNYNGGFEEYAVIPEKILRKDINPVIDVPRNVPLYLAAISEPFACAYHAYKKLVRSGPWKKERNEYDLIRSVRKEDVVVVLGGGPLGCMHAELARIFGAEQIIIAHHTEWKLEMIKKLGVADHYVLNRTTESLQREIDELTNGRGADVVITAASNPIIQMQALRIARQGGVVSFFGGVDRETVELPTNKIHYNGPFVTGTSGASPYHISIILDLMSKGMIDGAKYVTHVLGLDFLEKVLVCKGIPNFEPFSKVVASRGGGFFDFLASENLGLEQKSLEKSAEIFKGQILKALVVPNRQEESGIESLIYKTEKERKEILTTIVK